MLRSDRLVLAVLVWCVGLLGFGLLIAVGVAVVRSALWDASGKAYRDGWTSQLEVRCSAEPREE